MQVSLFAPVLEGLVVPSPVPPQQPLHVLGTVSAYASQLFYVEAREYSRDPQLGHWLEKLAERIKERVLRAVDKIDASPTAKRLSYHGVTTAQMRETIDAALQLAIEKQLRQAAAPDSQTRTKEQVIRTQSATMPSEIAADQPISKQIAELCDECRWTVEELAEAVELSPRSVYRHLSEDAAPRKRQLAAYEKAFSTKLKRQVTFKRQVNVKSQQSVILACIRTSKCQ